MFCYSVQLMWVKETCLLFGTWDCLFHWKYYSSYSQVTLIAKMTGFARYNFPALFQAEKFAIVRPKESDEKYKVFSFQEREQNVEQCMRHYLFSLAIINCKCCFAKFSSIAVLSLTIYGYIKRAQSTSPTYILTFYFPGSLLGGEWCWFGGFFLFVHGWVWGVFNTFT